MLFTFTSIVLALGGVVATIYFLVKDRKAKFALEKREQDISRRMYELAILKELGDRIGYSLDVQQIIDKKGLYRSRQKGLVKADKPQ